MFITREELKTLKQIIGSESYECKYGTVKGTGLLGRIEALEEYLKLEYVERDKTLPKYVKKS